MPTSKKEAHARHQREYHARKMRTHTKVCVLVPNTHAGAFRRTVDRLKKKWAVT